jgi:hypothetical protein
MHAAVLTVSQMRYVNKAYWRNPAAAFFALVYPLMFLVIFTSIFRKLRGSVRREEDKRGDLLCPCHGCAGSNYRLLQQHRGRDHIPAGVRRPQADQRDTVAQLVVLRRLHTARRPCVGPARDDHGSIRARVLQRGHPHRATLARMLTMVVVGAAAFCALGLAISSVIPNANASRP